ncbi:MAG TPA: IS1595 family transposase [Streptosporangiaceae bacterium]|jgi:transposase-like protein
MTESENREPRTLLEAVRYFSDPDVALAFVVKLRWPDGKPACPRCGGLRHSFLTTRRIWKCRECKKQFSVKVGTIFEDSPLGFDVWLPAIWLVANSKNGISSHEMARSLGITQKSAWFLNHRIRLAMQTGTFAKLDGVIEADETFIGGKARFMHKHIRERKITGTGGKDKTVVAGIMERGGEVRATVVSNTKGRTLQAGVRANVEPGAIIYTDTLRSYSGLDADYVHETVDHAEKYVEGKIHINGMENFWCLLKRGLHGTYTFAAPFHLFRYLDERMFTFNERDLNDLGRFIAVVSTVSGRRLTYAGLIGKN